MSSVELKALILKDKFDTNTIGTLMSLEESNLSKLLPELILWIADINWPIATEILPVLSKYPDSIVPLIKENLVAGQDDDILKIYIISYLVPRLPKDYQIMLYDDISRIAKNPTKSEAYEETTEMAVEWLNSIEQV